MFTVPYDGVYSININLQASSIQGTYPSQISVKHSNGIDTVVTETDLYRGRYSFNAGEFYYVRLISSVKYTLDRLSYCYLYENKIPLITGQYYIETNKNQPVNLKPGYFIIDDSDSSYPGDFIIEAVDNIDADYHITAGHYIFPPVGFTGDMIVPVVADDGVNQSPVFNCVVRVVEPLQMQPSINNIAATPVSIQSGDNYAISFNLQNTGDMPANNYTIEYWWSKTKNIDNSSFFINKDNYETLIPGADVSLVKQLEAPDCLVSQDGFIIIRLVANNNSNTFIKIYPVNINITSPPVDLVFTNIESVSVAGNGLANIDFSIANNSYMAIPPTQTTFYLSHDNVIDADDKIIAISDIPVIQNGETITMPVEIAVNYDVPSGNYYILGKCDANNYIDEDNEENNIFISPLIVLPDLPDVGAGNITSIPQVIEKGWQFSIKGIVRNQTTNTINNVKTGFYLSTDCYFDAADQLLNETVLNSFEANTIELISVDCNMNSNTPTGEYYILMKTDSDNQITEANEENNIAYTKVFVIDTQHGDLVVSGINVNENILCGSNTSVSVKITNKGYASTASSLLACYASIDNNKSAEDILIGQIQTGTINSGTNSTHSFNMHLTNELPEGINYIIAIADANNQVNETNENNNLYVTQFNYSCVNSFDITAENLAAGNSINAGEEMELLFSITVSGTGVSNSGNATVYLSTDSELSSNDTELSVTEYQAIWAGTSTDFLINVNIPSGTNPGQYYVIVNADAENTSAETNENNNVTYKPINVTTPLPDIEVEIEWHYGNTFNAGEEAWYTYYVHNTGNGIATGVEADIYFSVSYNESSEEYRIATDYIGTLQPGQTYNGDISYILPANTPSGTYYFTVDGSCNQNETRYYNNMDYINITVENPNMKPDLVVSNMSVTGSQSKSGNSAKAVAIPEIYAGSNAYVSANTYNYGNASTNGSSYTAIYLSDNSYYDGSDTYLTRDYVPYLSAGSYDRMQYKQAMIPASTPSGYKYIVLRTDYYNNIAESNEANNTNAVLIKVINSGGGRRSDGHNDLPKKAVAGWQLFPNPANTNVSIAPPVDKTVKLIKLMNTSGKVIRNITGDIISEDGLIHIDVSDLLPDMYYLVPLRKRPKF